MLLLLYILDLEHSHLLKVQHVNEWLLAAVWNNEIDRLFQCK